MCYEYMMPVTFLFDLLVRYEIVSLQPRHWGGTQFIILSIFFIKAILSDSVFVANICFL
jgi:hypothetical protein